MQIRCPSCVAPAFNPAGVHTEPAFPGTLTPTGTPALSCFPWSHRRTNRAMFDRQCFFFFLEEGWAYFDTSLVSDRARRRCSGKHIAHKHTHTDTHTHTHTHSHSFLMQALESAHRTVRMRRDIQYIQSGHLAASRRLGCLTQAFLSVPTLSKYSAFKPIHFFHILVCCRLMPKSLNSFFPSSIYTLYKIVDIFADLLKKEKLKYHIDISIHTLHPVPRWSTLRSVYSL